MWEKSLCLLWVVHLYLLHLLTKVTGSVFVIEVNEQYVSLN